MDCLSCLCWDLCIKLCVGVHEVGNGHGNQFQKVEQMLDEWAAHGQPTCSVLGL